MGLLSNEMVLINFCRSFGFYTALKVFVKIQSHYFR